jgi:hypothetical protein
MFPMISSYLSLGSTHQVYVSLTFVFLAIIWLSVHLSLPLSPSLLSLPLSSLSSLSLSPLSPSLPSLPRLSVSICLNASANDETTDGQIKPHTYMCRHNLTHRSHSGNPTRNLAIPCVTSNRFSQVEMRAERRPGCTKYGRT